MSATTYPKKLSEVVTALLDYGWSFQVVHNKDTGEHPYISIEARRENQHIMITWHTRAAGTYRIFTCMVNKRDVTLTKALEAVAA